MAFEVPPLPYGYDALKPTIDEETMKLHHDKHHQAYVDKLNGAVTEDAKLQGKSLDDIMTPFRRMCAPWSATTGAVIGTIVSSGRSCRPAEANRQVR